MTPNEITRFGFRFILFFQYCLLLIFFNSKLLCSSLDISGCFRHLACSRAGGLGNLIYNYFCVMFGFCVPLCNFSVPLNQTPAVILLGVLSCLLWPTYSLITLPTIYFIGEPLFRSENMHQILPQSVLMNARYIIKLANIKQKEKVWMLSVHYLLNLFWGKKLVLQVLQ